MLWLILLLFSRRSEFGLGEEIKEEVVPSPNFSLP
tara:strand:+ start:298 stop:402 length:105 start_codon:yes stop_codon:yes gene_type:complete